MSNPVILPNRHLNYAVSRWKQWGWRTDQIADVLHVPEHVVYNSLAWWRENQHEAREKRRAAA